MAEEPVPKMNPLGKLDLLMASMDAAAAAS
jgi:hypothetical protein